MSFSAYWPYESADDEVQQEVREACERLAEALEIDWLEMEFDLQAIVDEVVLRLQAARKGA